MKITIDPKDAKDFASATLDPNELHDEKIMRNKYCVPAIVSGFQLFMTSLAQINVEQLIAKNHGKAFFPKLVPTGNDIYFYTATTQNEERTRLLCSLNGIDVLSSDQDYANASRIVERAQSFFEGETPRTLEIKPEQLKRFQEITGLPTETIPALYSVATSSASIAKAIKNPKTPAWKNLAEGLEQEDEKRIRLPAYRSTEFYLPNGMMSYDSTVKLTQTSAIRQDNKTNYTIDTICYNQKTPISFVRSRLSQIPKRLIIRGIAQTNSKP